MTKIYRPFLLSIFILITVVLNAFLLNWIYPQLNFLHSSKHDENVALADTVSQDTIPVEEVPVPATEFITQDLKTLFLNGHVKEVIILTQKYDQETSMPLDEYEPSEWYEFNTDGKLTSYRTHDYKTRIKRNSRGQIVCIEEISSEDDGPTSGMSFEYGSNGYPKGYSEWCSDTFEEEYKQYNNKNWPTKGKAGEGMARTVFTYPDIDDHGNWLTKEANIKMSEVFEGEDDETIIVKRQIKYYE